jgi:hypothetical protein
MYTSSGLPQSPDRSRPGAQHSQRSLIHLEGAGPDDEVIRHERGSLRGSRSRLAAASTSPLRHHLTRDHEGLDGQLDAQAATPPAPWRPRAESRRPIGTGKRLRNRV